MRKFQIIGNVTKDAEVKDFNNGRSVINFDVAVNERWRDANGDKKEKAFYIRCGMWRDSAKTTIAQYIKKGVKLYLEGSPEAEAYVNKEGISVGVLKMNVRDFEFLSKREDYAHTGQQSGHQGANNQTAPGNQEEALVPTPDDDLPF